MTELQETFREDLHWTPPPPAMVTPVGWFSRLVWPLIRYRAYVAGRVVYVSVTGAGGGGGRDLPPSTSHFMTEERKP